MRLDGAEHARRRVGATRAHHNGEAACVRDAGDDARRGHASRIEAHATRHERSKVADGHDDVVEVHGGRTEAQRDHDVNELFEKRKATKLVANLQTGGTGLTMVAAEAEYFFSNTHNFVDRQQGEDRAHRKGQTKNVLIADVISQINFNSALYDTVDILPVESNEVKKDLAEYVRGRIDELAARGVSDISSIFGID